MRAFLLGFAILSLAACDSGNVPSPTERANGADNAAGTLDPGLVTLNGDGLAAGAEAFYFSAGKNEVTTALAKSLGAATGTAENPDCGAGLVSSASFPGGLTVNFQQGSLVGWNVDGGAENIAFAGDVGIGTPRTDVEATAGFVTIAGSTLDDEFALGDAIGGFFEDGAVSMLYGGTQCFAR